MTLRTRTILIIGAALVALIAIVYVTSQAVLLRSFVVLEEYKTSEHVERALDALAANLSSLDSKTGDWANWDDAYNFVEEGDPEFVQINATDKSFSEIKINLMVFIHASGRIVFIKAFDLESAEEIPVAENVRTYFTTHTQIQQHPDTKSSIQGIVLLPQGPLLVASRPILTSQGEGPMRGTLIFGRYLDAAEVERLAQTTHLSLTVRHFDDAQLPSDFQTARSALAENPAIFVQPLSEQSIAGYAPLKDIYGQPVLLLRVDRPRDIYQHGQASVQYFILLFSGVALLFGVVAQGLVETLSLSWQRQRESEERYRTLAEAAQDMIFIVNHDDEVQYVNPFAAKQFGVRPGELIGKPRAALFPPDVSERQRRSLQSVFDTGQPAHFESQIPFPGREVWQDTSLVPLSRDQAGRVTAVLGISRDITERKEVEERIRREAARAEALARVAARLNAQLDLDAVLNAVCEETAHALNVPAVNAYLYDDRLDALCPVMGFGAPAEHRERLQPVPCARYDEMVRQMGRMIVIPDVQTFTDMPNRDLMAAANTRTLVFASMFREKQLVGVLGVVTFGQVRHFSDDELVLLQGLADQAAQAITNARLYSFLQKTNVQLQAALRAKDEMIQNVSHELRTPLTLIHGYVQLLQGAVLGPLTAEQEGAVQVMYRQGERLAFMIDRLLMLQRIGPDVLQRVTLDLGLWLRQTVQPWEMRVAGTGIRLRLEVSSPLPPLQADPNFLGHVVENLLDNAIKFSPNGGVVRVRAWAEGDQAIIAVSDQGIGIPPDKLGRLFERFYQVNGSTSRRFGGMGIGLALCKVIVEAHGGRIWAESAGEGRGSTFYVALPAEGTGRRGEGETR